MLDPTLVEAMRGLVVPPIVIGQGRADTWFDGFWDFFVAERSRLTNEPSVWVSGTSWFLLHWRTDPSAEAAGLDLFVEAKDRRPGAMAPAPVVTVSLTTGEPVTRAELPPRALDPECERVLRAHGFSLLVGYWGVRARRAPGAALSTAELASVVASACTLVRD